MIFSRLAIRPRQVGRRCQVQSAFRPPVHRQLQREMHRIPRAVADIRSEREGAGERGDDGVFPQRTELHGAGCQNMARRLSALNQPCMKMGTRREPVRS